MNVRDIDFSHITCGKYWQFSLREFLFDSIFYFSIKLPFHSTRRRRMKNFPTHNFSTEPNWIVKEEKRHTSIFSFQFDKHTNERRWNDEMRDRITSTQVNSTLQLDELGPILEHFLSDWKFNFVKLIYAQIQRVFFVSCFTSFSISFIFTFSYPLHIKIDLLHHL